MAEKIFSKDIFGDDLTKKQIKEFEALIKVLEDLEKQQKANLKLSAEELKMNAKEYDSVKKNQKAIEDFEKAEKELTATEKERIKLQNKLNQLNEESFKDNVKLKTQIQEKNKALKEEAKEELGLVDAYTKKSKKLNQLRKDYKNLILQEGKATKETKELKREIQNLDRELKDLDADVGQFQRNVGDYANAIKEAGGDVTGAFGGAFLGTAFGNIASKATDFFNVSKEAGDNAKKSLIPVLASLQVALASLVDIIPVLIKDIKVFGVEIQKAFLKITNPFSDVTEEVAKFDKQIAELEKNFKGKGYADAFANFGERVDETSEQMLKNIEVNREAEIRILSLSRAISKLTAEEEKLRTEADNNNLSFQERTKAFEEARKIADKRAKAEIELAKEQLKVQEGLVKEQLKQAGVNEDLTDILTNKSKAQKVDEETLLAYVEALNAVTDAEGQRNQQIAQDSKEATDIARDLFEQNLDYALDYTDNQKSINERLIADDSLTLETRKKLLADTNAIFKKALDQQVDLFEEFTGKDININELLSAEDSGTLLETVRALGLGEIETQRLLEVIRDYKTGVQDLSEAQKDLNLSEQEYNDLLIETQENVKFLNGEYKTQEELDEAITRARIENLKKVLESLKEFSVEYLRILKEIQDLEISLIEDQTEELDKQKEIREATEQVITELVDKYTTERINAIDKEIEANQRRQETLRQLASQGIQDAKDNLAQEKKQQAELEREKERALKRQQQIELGLAVLNSYSNNVENDADNPLAKTITDTQVLLQFIQSLPTFYDGTENTGQGGQVDNKGGFHAILHPNERVMTAEQNQQLDGISNWELANIGKEYKDGKLNNTILVDNSEVVNKLDEIVNKPTYLGRDYDATEKAIIETIQSKGRIERNHKRTGNNKIF